MPVQRLTEYDARLIEQFLQRRYQLVNAEQMSAQIIEQMRARMELPPQAFSSPSVGIAWLAEVLEAYRTRHRL
jgi:hypothetical protein